MVKLVLWKLHNHFMGIHFVLPQISTEVSEFNFEWERWFYKDRDD